MIEMLDRSSVVGRLSVHTSEMRHRLRSSFSGRVNEMSRSTRDI